MFGIKFKEKKMYNVQKIKDDVFYIGASDRRLALFESVFPALLSLFIQINMKIKTPLIRVVSALPQCLEKNL